MRTCERLRDGRAPAEGLAFSATADGLSSRIRSPQGAPQGWERTANSIGTTAGLELARGDSFGNSPDDACRDSVGNFRNATRMVGTLRLWHVSAGGIPALLLGPLAVDSTARNLGVGTALMDHALAAATARGHRAVILLGDEAYYTRFGFSLQNTATLSLPGPFERERLLGLELQAGALSGAFGMIVPTGTLEAKAKLVRRAPRARAA